MPICISFITFSNNNNNNNNNIKVGFSIRRPASKGYNDNHS